MRVRAARSNEAPTQRAPSDLEELVQKELVQTLEGSGTLGPWDPGTLGSLGLLGRQKRPSGAQNERSGTTRLTFGAAPCASRARTPIAGEHRLRKRLKVVEAPGEVIEDLHVGAEGSCCMAYVADESDRRMREVAAPYTFLDHSIYLYLRLSPVPDPWVLTSISSSAEQASFQTLATFLGSSSGPIPPSA